MEFRKCPACEASVLDDDAAECPFCGASMSGKPSARPAKPASPSSKAPPADKSTAKQAPAKPATQQPAGKSSAGRTALAQKSEPEEDADPFDVDTSAVSQAPPVAPRPAKGRMIRIVCPMCETPGFISAKMQGRDVKCCNPDCMVPVYKAPRPEKKAEPEAAASGGLSTKWLALGTAVLLPLVGGLVWYFGLSDRGPKKYVPTQGPPVGVEQAAIDPEANDVVKPPPDKQPPSAISLAKIQQLALERSIDAARKRDNNRSKPYCRRMTAEAYAQIGDLKAAKNQIKLLQGVTTESFYRVEPLVEIAWQQLQAGDRSAADKTIAEAFEAARDFPEVGRPAAAAVVSVVAALVAVDRIEDAQEVIGRLDHDDDTSRSRERVAALVEMAFALEMFDLDRMLRYSSLDMVAEPLAVGATIVAAAHGYWDQAVAWSLAGENASLREDSLAALAVVAAWHAATTGDAAPLAAVRKAGEKLSAVGRSRMAAGAATGSLMQEDREAATSALGQALALMEGVPRPKALPKPTVKGIYDSSDSPNNGLPAQPEPLRSAAVGAAQMARLQALMGEREAAWTTLLKAWEFTQGIGPEHEATSKLADEIANQSNRAEQRLLSELGLSNRNQDLVRRAMSRYRRQVGLWGEAAGRRFDLEVALLNEAVAWGLLDQVADVLTNPAEVIPAAVGQNYRSSSLPITLSEAYLAAGNKAKSDEMAKLSPRRGDVSDQTALVLAGAERLFQQKQYVKAAQALGQFQHRHYVEQRRDLLALQLSCRMAKLKKPELYFPFILALGQNQPVLTEDCFELTAALAVQEGMAPDLWKRYSNEGLSATQQVAFYRGLIAGIVAKPASPPPAAKETADAATPPKAE